MTQTPIIFPQHLTTDCEQIHLEEKQFVIPNPGPKYKGKVVVLINEETVSNAEHACLLLESCTDVTFIGSPTSGANGNVTNVNLPGGILVGFTGL